MIMNTKWDRRIDKLLGLLGWKCPVCQDVKLRLKGHDCSRLDGENGLAAATMRGYETLLAQSEWAEEGDPSAGAMLRNEIRSVIRRYGQESDITAYQALGALRVVEHDILDMMDSAVTD
jgi:hypothetical protein